jgi:plasmid stabilization system protein ParE
LIVILADSAEAELEAIGDWIAKDSPMRAIRFARELRDACEKLGKRPKAYALLPHRKADGIRKRT